MTTLTIETGNTLEIVGDPTVSLTLRTVRTSRLLGEVEILEDGFALE